MVSFKGKSTAIGVVADNSRGTKNTSIRDFKVYSDLEKTKVRGVDENALITAAKSSMALRKSLPVKKGNLPTDFAHIMKVCDENLRQSMNKRQDSVNAKSGRRVLADVSNLKNNVSRTAVNTGSKAVKIHNGKNQCMPRIAAGQCTTGASMSSRKLVMGTSKTVQKIRTEVYHTSKKVDSRNIKVFPESQKTKGPGHDSFGIDGRKIVRRPLVITRKSLPVFERSSQIGSNGSVFERSSQIDSNGLKGNGRSSERGGVKLDKIKVGRKAVTNVSITRTSLQKSRASDSFPSAVSLGQSIIDTGGTSGKSVEVKISSNSKEIMLTKMARSNYSRRQSFTSCLLAKSEVLRDCSEVVKKENLPSIDDKQNHLEVAEYVEDIYEYYWVMEAQYPSISNYMTFQKDITPKMRGILVNWLIEVHLKFELMQETLFLMVALFDRFLSVVPIERNEMQLVGLTALLLASKYEDFWHPKIKELLSISSGSYTRDQMLAMEKLILKKLMFRLNTPTSYVFMLRFLKAAQSDRKMEHLAFYLTELCLTEYEALNYKTSLLCASAIYVARCTLQISPAWSPLLCKHTHYEESELRDCADMILRFHKASGKGSLKVTYDKYMLPDQSCVARIKALSRLPH